LPHKFSLSILKLNWGIFFNFFWIFWGTEDLWELNLCFLRVFSIWMVDLNFLENYILGFFLENSGNLTIFQSIQADLSDKKPPKFQQQPTQTPTPKCPSISSIPSQPNKWSSLQSKTQKKSLKAKKTFLHLTPNCNYLWINYISKSR